MSGGVEGEVVFDLGFAPEAGNDLVGLGVERDVGEFLDAFVFVDDVEGFSIKEEG